VLWPAWALMVVIGLPGALLVAGALTVFQTATDAGFRGRVYGAILAMQGIAQLVGTALAGTLPPHLGIVPVIAAQGAGYAVAGLLVLLTLRTAAPSPEPEPQMNESVAVVHDLVSRVPAADPRDRSETLAWLESTDDVFRRVKPDTPPKHLVSYVVPIDPADGAVLLVAHRNAGLWLPPGGHVDPGEHPATTASRELEEELGLSTGAAADPVFLSVTVTVGLDSGHTDVSLWFRASVSRDTPLIPDTGEFSDVRWWSRADLDAADPTCFDPEMDRFLAALV
jgi:8-oxo-dGTP diphosphatase